jgi:LPXTG-motif cell wall-anchored protein
VTFLPRTGADLTRLLAVAASAIVLGALLVGLSTRRSGRRH